MARQRGDEREQRRAQRDGAVRGAEHESVRERQVVVVDEIGDRRVARGQEHQARDLDRERPDVDPPELVHERHHDDDRGADDVHRDHHPAAIPARDGARRERSADRTGEEPQREDAADRGRRARLLKHQCHERHGAHPVAQRGHRLTDEQRAVAGPPPEHRDAHARPSDSTAGPSRSSVPSRSNSSRCT